MLQIYPLFFMRFFIIFKKEKYWHYNDSMRPIINFIIDNRPIVYRYMLKVLKHIPINILKTFFFRISKIFLMSALSSVSTLILISPETESLTLKQPWRLSFVWVLLLSRMSFLNSMTFLLLHLLLLPLSRLEAKSSLKLSRLYLMASGTMSRKSAIGHQCTACQKKRTDTAGNLCTYAYV